MKKYEIYLPLKYNDGTDVEPEKLKQIRNEVCGSSTYLSRFKTLKRYECRQNVLVNSFEPERG